MARPERHKPPPPGAFDALLQKSLQIGDFSERHNPCGAFLTRSLAYMTPGNRHAAAAGNRHTAAAWQPAYSSRQPASAAAGNPRLAAGRRQFCELLTAGVN